MSNQITDEGLELFWIVQSKDVGHLKDLLETRVNRQTPDSARPYKLRVHVSAREEDSSERVADFSSAFTKEMILKIVQDANRYRWLRKNLLNITWTRRAKIKWNWIRVLVGPDCDLAIDKLIASDRKDGANDDW